MKIILASTSPYRAAQLKAFGLSFSARRPGIDEEALKNSLALTPRGLSRRLALEKARSLVKKNPKDAIIGADQLLDFEGAVLGKPGSLEQNIRILSKLQGRTHKLITSMALVCGERSALSTVVAQITLKKLTRAEIAAYVKRDRPMDCAGGYRFESSGFSLVESLRVSDPSSLIGLSLIELPKLFSKLNLPIMFK